MSLCEEKSCNQTNILSGKQGAHSGYTETTLAEFKRKEINEITE